MEKVKERRGFQFGGHWLHRRRRLQDWFPELSEITEPDYHGPGDDVDWIPAIDLIDRGQELLLIAELPGVKKEGIKITLENNVLWLRGERHPQEEGQVYLCREWLYGYFSRRIRLPVDIQEDKITTFINNGVLRMMLPKSLKWQPRDIEIE